MALSIIISLFLCGLYCTLLWFPPWTSFTSAIHLAVFISWLLLIMNYFLKSIWLGPGYLPLSWRPQVSNCIHVLPTQSFLFACLLRFLFIKFKRKVHSAKKIHKLK